MFIGVFLPGVPKISRGAPGDTYVSRPPVTTRGDAPTALQRSWVPTSKRDVTDHGTVSTMPWSGHLFSQAPGYGPKKVIVLPTKPDLSAAVP
ncbi:hypothetical protein GCM10009554_13940 [Kribbella koreensis]|uniref:Uncharacterized protein n=2 Tax=Kribbella TaxID=182639 RepID=A0ABP6YMK8_9ACTN